MGGIIVILILALFVGLIYFYEIRQAYKTSHLGDAQKSQIINSLTTNMDNLVKAATAPGTTISSDDLTKFKDMLSDVKSLLDEKTTGIEGFTRGQIAITVIFILGAAIILITFSLRSNDTLVTNVLSMLSATLAAVVGFYFGGKAAETAGGTKGGTAGGTAGGTKGGTTGGTTGGTKAGTVGGTTGGAAGGTTGGTTEKTKV